MNVYITPIEEVTVFFMKSLNLLNEIRPHELSTIGPTLDPCKVQDAVDIVGQPVRILNHVPDIPELVFPGKLIFPKSLQIQFQRSDGGLQFVGEIADKVTLESVKLECLLIVNKDDEYAHQNDPHKNGKHQNHHPGLRGQNLIGIEVGSLQYSLQPCADLHIPVDI
jgi:hypothetical protein